MKSIKFSLLSLLVISPTLSVVACSNKYNDFFETNLKTYFVDYFGNDDGKENFLSINMEEDDFNNELAKNIPEDHKNKEDPQKNFMYDYTIQYLNLGNVDKIYHNNRHVENKNIKDESSKNAIIISAFLSTKDDPLESYIKMSKQKLVDELNNNTEMKKEFRGGKVDVALITYSRPLFLEFGERTVDNDKNPQNITYKVKTGLGQLWTERGIVKLNLYFGSITINIHKVPNKKPKMKIFKQN